METPKDNNDNLRLELFAADTRSHIELETPLSQVQAGFPSPATDYLTEAIDLNRELIQHPECTFFARIKGDSMQEAHILDGDLAVVDKSLQARDGDYVVAYIDGEFTIKEFRNAPDGKSGWLIPHNPKYRKIHVTEDNEFIIWGVITYLIHKA